MHIYQPHGSAERLSTDFTLLKDIRVFGVIVDELIPGLAMRARARE